MQFQDIPGMSETKEVLIRAATDSRLSHALLLHGLPGGASLPVALALAQFLLCENMQDQKDSCAQCNNCQRVARGIHPDLHFFFPSISASQDSEYDKKLHELTSSFRHFLAEHPFGLVEDWTHIAGLENKNLLIGRQDTRRILNTVSMKSVEGNFKILLLWLPEYLNPTAANALLKVLEEPPNKTLFLMVSHHYDRLLQTITSRSVLYNIPPLATQDIVALLRKAGIEEAMSIAHLAQGSAGRALRMSRHPEEMNYEAFREWMLACVSGDYAELLALAEQFHREDKMIQRSKLETGMHVLTDTLSTEGRMKDNFVGKFAQFLNPAKSEKAYVMLNEALNHLSRNANPKMTHFHLSQSFVKLLSQ